MNGRLLKTKVGKQAAFLDVSLAHWLGKRLKFLAIHGTSVPQAFILFVQEKDPVEKRQEVYQKIWKQQMRRAADDLIAYSKILKAEDRDGPVLARGNLAMQWVAEWFPCLWD